MFVRLQQFVHNYRQRCQKRRAVRDAYWEARRKQHLAYKRRQQRMAQLGPVAKARMERRERNRLQRKRDEYQGARGLMIGMSVWARPEAGKISLVAALVVAALIGWFMFMTAVPLMITAGLLYKFAYSLFELPGLKQALEVLLKIACNKVSKAVGEMIGGDDGLIPSILGGVSDAINWVGSKVKDGVTGTIGLAADGFKGLGNIVNGVPVVGGALKVTFNAAGQGSAIVANSSGAVIGGVTSIISGGFDLVKLGLNMLKRIQDFSCALEQMLDIFKKQGLEDPMRSALSCANWPSYLGPLKSPENMTSDGTPKYCIDPRKKNDAQSLVPSWLKPIYQAAAQEYNVPWELLAAINWNDTEYGAKELNSQQKSKKMKVDAADSADLSQLRSMFGLPGALGGPDEVSQKFLEYYNLDPKRKKKAKEQAQSIVEAATQVNSEWQQPNPKKKDRAGWIPLDKGEWKDAGGDWGNVPPNWSSSPYKGEAQNSPQACPMPVATDGSAVAGGTPLPAQDIGGAGVMTKNQIVFSDHLAAITGMDVNLVQGWVLAEMSGPYALRREAEKNYNWLNIGYFDKLGGGGAFQGIRVWNDPRKAAEASAAFLEGHFLGASKGIQNILRSVGKPVNEQIRAIAVSGWASSGYENGASLRGTYKIVKKRKQPARIKVRWTHPKTKKVFTLGDGPGGSGGSFVATNAPVNVSFKADGLSDTCDPVDSVFALAHWLSLQGAAGDTWNAALVDTIKESKLAPLRTKVTVISDGLVESSQLAFAMEPNRAEVNEDNGRSAASGVRELRKLKQQKKVHKITVMALGANDPKASDSDMRKWIRGTMDIVGRESCVVWPTSYIKGKARFVKPLMQAEKSYDNFVAPRWDSTAGKFIDKNDPDGRRPNDQGRIRYAEIVAQGVTKCNGGSSEPVGTGMTVKGKGSAFGAIYDNRGRLVKVDPGDVGPSGAPLGVACAGHSHREPGVAIRPGPTWQSSSTTSCGWWWIKGPNGKAFVLQQIDVGPHQSTGRRFDLNDRAVKMFGYKGRDSFPTDQGTWTGVYLGKQRPADINIAKTTTASSMTLEGDSLSSDAPFQQSLRRQLKGWRIQIDAQSGRSVPTGLQRMRKLRLKPVVVFALGSNSWDVGSAGNRRWIQNAMAQAGKSRCVVLTTVYTGGRARPQWDNQVRWAAKHYGPKRVQIADWTARLRRGDIRLADGTHPATARDEAKRAALIAAAAKRCASKVGGSWEYTSTPRTGSLKNLLKTNPPRSFNLKAVPPLKELRKPNKDLPDAGWVHDAAAPLDEKFPSFRSGLFAGRLPQSDCQDLKLVQPSRAQQGTFYSAGKAFNIPWQLLSAYAAVRSAYSCQGGAYSQVRGGYETDANGDGVYRPEDPVDGIFSNARSLLSYGGDKQPVAAVRKLTTDPAQLVQIASIARQLGYNSAGLVKITDDGIGAAVQKRDHLINKSVCQDQDDYTECIASLYRKILGVEDSSGSPGGWLTGGCTPPPVPDTTLKPYSVNQIAKRGSSSGAYTKVKTVKGVASASGHSVSGPSTWARKDALMGQLAALRTFIACNPKYNKMWKANIRLNDWGAGAVKSEWATSYKHATHVNGGDNDLNVDGVTDMKNTLGVTYNRGLANKMARMILRAGAYQIIFNDPKVQADVTAARAKFKKQNSGVAGKLGIHWTDSPIYPASGHENHFHIHWYAPSSSGPQRNYVPANVKVWITDKSQGAARATSRSCPRSGANRGAGPHAKTVNSRSGCTQPPSSSGRRGGKRSNPVTNPFGPVFGR